MSTSVNQPPMRSTFVSALAWVFIVLAGFATMISVLQNIMVNFMFPLGDMKTTVEGAKTAGQMPWFAALVFENIRLVFASFLLLSAATLISAVGLLRRRNWARLIFMGLMGLGIIWNVAGVVLSFAFISAMPPVPATAPDGFADQFALMSKVMIGFNTVLAIAFTALFVWIIKRLVSVEVRNEFSAAAQLGR